MKQGDWLSIFYKLSNGIIQGKFWSVDTGGGASERQAPLRQSCAPMEAPASRKLLLCASAASARAAAGPFTADWAASV